MPTLPDVKGKVVLDDSALSKAGQTATKAGDQIKKGMQTGTQHTLRFQQSLTTLLDHFGGMPPVVNEAGRSIESMASQGVGGMTLLGGAALVAVGAVAEVVHASMDAYQRIGGEVEDFRRVTGASAEESSKLIYVFNAVGVSGDSAAQGVFRLSKAIETGEKKLEDLGIVVARDAQGNVMLTKTLMNVSDAYNATADPAKRNLLLFQAFGRAGRDMIPVLEQGSKALEAMESSASLLFTEADLQRLKDAKIHTQEVKSAWEEWWAASVGQPATDAQNSMAEALLAQTYAEKKLDEAVAHGTMTAQQRTQGGAKLLSRYEDEYYALQGVREQTDKTAAATKAAADANDAESASIDKLVGHQQAQVNSSYALKLADLAVKENSIHLREAQDRVALSSDKVATSQQAVTDARNRFGVKSPEYKKAIDDLKKAQDDLVLAQDDVTKTTIDNEKNIYAAAAAARKLQEDTDVAATGQKDAAKETQAYVDKLYEEEQALDANSPLRKNIEELIAQIGRVPTQVITKFEMQVQGYVPKLGSERSQRELGYEAGGHPPTNRPIWVGEHGPEIWTPDGPGTITPNGGIPPTPAGGGDHLEVTVNAETNADPHDIAQEGAWELRKMRRNF